MVIRGTWSAMLLTCAFALRGDGPHMPAGSRIACTPEIKRRVELARGEVRRGVRYDASYRVLEFPGGDPPRDRGACTDVLIRACRADGIDLQQRVNHDMKQRFREYPRRYGLAKPDPNIDHRRVPNLRVFFGRHGRNLTCATSGAAADSWKPGDIVFWKLPGGVLDHCGMLTDTRGASGLPTVVHNLGGAAEEDCVGRWKIVGHVRYP
jgi:uncharacterized protein YijF (DUF1287 family)